MKPNKEALELIIKNAVTALKGFTQYQNNATGKATSRDFDAFLGGYISGASMYYNEVTALTEKQFEADLKYITIEVSKQMDMEVDPQDITAQKIG